MNDEEFMDTGPSKSERKRQSQELQDLGEALIELPSAELDALPLPDALRDAVLLARRITKHGGLYRQKQLIGKLMRKIDAEPIRVALETRRERARTAARQFHALERWRARLISDASVLDEFVRNFPRANREVLQRLIAQARAEPGPRATKAARDLFAAIQQAVVGASSESRE